MHVKLTALTVIVLGFAAAPSASEADTITGTVTATPAKFLPDTVVYLQGAPAPHAPKTATMDQQNMKFTPHVLAITKGDTVEFQNHDHVDHNVYSPEGGYTLGTWGFGQVRRHTFDRAGVFTQLCSLHPDMLGYVFVGDNPYHAVVDASGHFELTGVPPGRYQLAVWNSHLHAKPQSVTVTAGQPQHVSISLAR